MSTPNTPETDANRGPHSMPQAGPQFPGLISRRGVERAGASLLILYSLAVTVSVAARVISGADQVTALESIMMIGVNSGWYVGHQTANLISALILVALSAVTYRVFQHTDRNLALVGAFMLIAAGIFSSISSIGGLALAQEFGGPHPAQVVLTAGNPESTYVVIEPLRELAAQVGFTFSGLALLALGGLLAWSGALPRWLGWLGILAGVLMFFIWNPNATALHRIGGGAYLLWLLLLAGWLLFRGTQETTAGDIYAETGDD